MIEVRRGRSWLALVLGSIAVAGSSCGRIDPEDLKLRAQTEFNTGHFAKAEASLAQLARLRVLSLPERLLRARAAGARGQFDQALAILDQARGPTNGPGAALLAATRGGLELDRWRFRAAEAELKRALSLDAGCTDARRRLMKLYVQQRRWEEYAKQATLVGPDVTLDFYDLYFWTLGPDERLNEAELAKALERVTAGDPGDRQSQLALAECLRRLGCLDRAESVLATLPETDPEVCAVSALIALDRADAPRAEACLEKAHNAEDHPAIARLRARLALAKGDIPSAMRGFQAVLKVTPEDRSAQLGLSQALRLTAAPDAARPYADAARASAQLQRLVERARQEDRSTDPTTLWEIGSACLMLDRRDQALAWYRLALSYAPNNLELQNAYSRLISANRAKP
jgi:tetratricopeptide (TPR) repeat protein